MFLLGLIVGIFATYYVIFLMKSGLVTFKWPGQPSPPESETTKVVKEIKLDTTTLLNLIDAIATAPAPVECKCVKEEIGEAKKELLQGQIDLSEIMSQLLSKEVK
jgi:hypothetical protein